MMTALLLCTACSSDDYATDKATAAVPEGKVIHYMATVGEGDETRATLNSSKKYVFQTGDKLVISGENISGDLTLTGDPGTTATFEGDLNYTGDGTPADDLTLNAVLVSTSNAMTTLTFASAEYPTTAVASTLADAVEKYSHFTATSTYAAKDFKVSQQTSFLNFTVTFENGAAMGTTAGTAFDIKIANGGSIMRTGSVTTTTDANSKVVAQFVAAMPKGTTMSSAWAQLGSTVAITFGGTTTLAANKIYNISKTVTKPVAVNLGLSSGTKWASMNVGAPSESDYGLFFAWGETAGYSSVKFATMTDHDFRWANYKWSAGSKNGSQFSKYVPSSKSSYWGGTGSADNKTKLDAADDAARANWGGSWRMPTYGELNELYATKSNTTDYTWEWTTVGGHNGYKITRKSTSAYIFLPAAGYRYVSSLGSDGSYGYYWSSTLGSDNVSYGRFLGFGSVSAFMSGSYRYYGYTVRAVQ